MADGRHVASKTAKTIWFRLVLHQVVDIMTSIISTAQLKPNDFAALDVSLNNGP